MKKMHKITMSWKHAKDRPASEQPFGVGIEFEEGIQHMFMYALGPYTPHDDQQYIYKGIIYEMLDIMTSETYVFVPRLPETLEDLELMLAYGTGN